MKKFFAVLIALMIFLPMLPAHAEDVPLTASGAETAEAITVGAIRWDAWYGHEGNYADPLMQVEKTLSPAKYHFRAPFFAEINEKGNIYIERYTQETCDQELQYAIDAGLDYFAYCWYDNQIANPRIYHINSTLKEKIKLCAIIDNNGMGVNKTHREMKKILGESFYMTVLGDRPLIYFYATKDNHEKLAKDIAYYRDLCKNELNLPDPYAVIMGVGGDDMLVMGGDACSRYGYVVSGGISYEELTNLQVQNWEGYRTSDTPFVPQITTGWHCVPRAETPVSWMTVEPDSYAEYATPEELTKHVQYALSYLGHSKTQKTTEAHTAIIYAWNEHDEGGWICPTLGVDAEGSQLYNDDGTKKIDDSRLQAVKKAITAYKNGEVLDVGLGPNETATPQSTAVPETEQPEQPKKTGCGSACLMPVLAVLPSAMCFKNKKKKENA